jgi:hypothetical protein
MYGVDGDRATFEAASADDAVPTFYDAEIAEPGTFDVVTEVYECKPVPFIDVADEDDVRLQAQPEDAA